MSHSFIRGAFVALLVTCSGVIVWERTSLFYNENASEPTHVSSKKNAVFLDADENTMLPVNANTDNPTGAPATAAPTQSLKQSERVNTDSLLLISSTTEDLFATAGPLLVGNLHNGKDLVVTFVDTGYLDTLSVWLEYYKRYNHSNIVLCLFALSGEAFDSISRVLSSNQNNIQENLGAVVLTQGHLKGNNLGSIWTLRVKLLQRIVNTFPTNNVVYTDVDALWLKDPQTIYRDPAHSDSTIVASRGTFPPQCSLAKEPYGKTITICFGCTYFCNSPSLQQLTADLIQEIPKYGNDDQRATTCKWPYFTYILRPIDTQANTWLGTERC